MAHRRESDKKSAGVVRPPWLTPAGADGHAAGALLVCGSDRRLYAGAPGAHGLALATRLDLGAQSHMSGQAHSSRDHMPKITYIAHGGETFEVTAEVGSTVMENGIRAMVPGIEAECGGACACATCHVYVDDAFAEIVGGPSPMEEDMLDFAYDVRPTSRLSCQIKVSEALDGLVVRVPERQG
jgi:2Fe-2S ferredoxin